MKYYAVKEGKVPGIYTTWDECKENVNKVPGAVYKSFKTMEEAEAFLKEDSQKEIYNINAVSTKEHLIAYVDGSFDKNTFRYAYGCVFVLPDDVKTLNGTGDGEDMVSMRNVAGEVLGSQNAILWAIKNGYKEITIYYDYEGIEKWATGVWKANKPGTIAYQEFIKEKREEITIHFQKVDAHTGVQYNEMADQLAKTALGL